MFTYQEESLEIVAWSSCTFIIKGSVTTIPTNEMTPDVQRSWETFDTKPLETKCIRMI